MSDYANLREAYYILATTPPDPPAEYMAMIEKDRAAWANRNPDPVIDPALLFARNQAEWFAVQDALSTEEPTADQTALLAELRALADDDEPETPPVTPPPADPPPTDPPV